MLFRSCTNTPSGWPLSSPPPRVGYAFLQYLALHGGPRNSLVCATWAQTGQNVLQKGVPPDLTTFSRTSRAATTLSPKSDKSGEIPLPPAGPSVGGFRIFSRNSATTWSGARDLPRIVFLEGGMTPCGRNIHFFVNQYPFCAVMVQGCRWARAAAVPHCG